jgi:hypothetical protein
VLLHRLFTIFSALSAISCAATALLWVRSYWISDAYGFSDRFAVWSDRGSIVVCREHPERDRFHLFSGSYERGYHREPLDDPDEFFNPRRVARKGWNVGVAHIETFPIRGTTGPIFTFLVIKFWPVLVLAGVLPVTWLLRMKRRRRRADRRASAGTQSGGPG